MPTTTRETPAPTWRSVPIPELGRDVELSTSSPRWTNVEPVTDEGYYLPPCFTASARLDDALVLAMEAEVRDRRLVVTRLEVVPAGARELPLELDLGRLPFRALLQESAALIALRRLGPKTDQRMSEPIGDDPLARAAFVRALRFQGRARKRRSRDEIDALLSQVAGVYLSANKAPVQAVMSSKNHWGPVSRATASRWIREARKAGLLRPAPLTGGFD